MRVAWVHPTWRDLVIERLAADAELRRHFLHRCGPHGLALAMSSAGGAAGERRLPLMTGDQDWDAVGDRIYALAPELEPPGTLLVLGALRDLVDAVRDDPRAAGEGAALARTALARIGELWEHAHAAVPLPLVEVWLDLAGRLDPAPWPTFLAATWADLLPVEAPDPADREAVQRLGDWLALCEIVRAFSPRLLERLGFGPDQRMVLRDFLGRVGEVTSANAGEPVTRALDGIVRMLSELDPLVRAAAVRIADAPASRAAEDPSSPWLDEDRVRRLTSGAVRRVLADL